jgi:hypothetical protein
VRILIASTLVGAMATWGVVTACHDVPGPSPIQPAPREVPPLGPAPGPVPGDPALPHRAAPAAPAAPDFPTPPCPDTRCAPPGDAGLPQPTPSPTPTTSLSLSRLGARPAAAHVDTKPDAAIDGPVSLPPVPDARAVVHDAGQPL